MKKVWFAVALVLPLCLFAEQEICLLFPKSDLAYEKKDVKKEKPTREERCENPCCPCDPCECDPCECTDQKCEETTLLFPKSDLAYEKKKKPEEEQESPRCTPEGCTPEPSCD